MELRLRFPILLLLLVTSTLLVVGKPQTGKEDLIFNTVIQLVTDKSTTSEEAEIKLNELHNKYLTQYSSQLLEKLIHICRSLYNNNKLDTAGIISNFITRVAEHLNDYKRLSEILHINGKIQVSRGKVKEALESYLRCKKLLEDQSKTNQLIYSELLKDLAQAYRHNAEYKLAMEAASLSMEISKGQGHNAIYADALLTLGSIYLLIGEYAEAIKISEESMLLFSVDNDPIGKSEALAYIGHAYRSMGHYLQALRSYIDSIAILKSLKTPTLKPKVMMARLYISLGSLYADSGDFERMEDNLNKSLQISIELKDKRGNASSLVQLGICYQNQGKFTEAIKFVSKGREMSERINARETLLTSIISLGIIHQQMNNQDAALQLFFEAEKLAEQMGSKIRLAGIYRMASESLFYLRDYHKSIEWAERSIWISTRLGLEDTVFKAYSIKAKAHLSLGQVNAARKSLNQAISTIEKLRLFGYGDEDDKQRYFENKVEPYHTMVELLVAEGKGKEALVFAEKAKSRSLLEILRSGRIKPSEFMTDDQQDTEARLYKEIIRVNNDIQSYKRKSQLDNNHLAQLHQKKSNAIRAYEEFFHLMCVKHPQIKLEYGNLDEFSLEAISRIIPDNYTALVEYVVSDEKLFVFILKKGHDKNSVNVSYSTVDIKKENLAKSIRSFLDLIVGRSLRVNENARYLYSLLVQPIEHHLIGVKNIGFIPDGPLWEVPFQALRSDKNRYLIEDTAIFLCPSLSVLDVASNQLSGRHKDSYSARSGHSLLAFGDPKHPDMNISVSGHSSLSSLPETRIEVNGIQGLYDQNRRSVYTGAQATEDRFRKEASQFSHLHFATHFVLNPHKPLHSYILMSRHENETNDDGFLYAWEIMNTRISSDLVVLSGCDTGRGHIRAGEGVIGMSWSFFVAGVSTAVVSHWKVRSEETVPLMIAFYDNLTRTRIKSDALRVAMRKRIETLINPHPYYWAGFSLVGNGL
jgi:CHAT domain-containing protein